MGCKVIKSTAKTAGFSSIGGCVQWYAAYGKNTRQMLTKVAAISIITTNNTPHASQRCAPWGVTNFRDNKTRQGYAITRLRKGILKPAGYLFWGVLK